MDILIDLSHYRKRLSIILAASSMKIDKRTFDAFVRFGIYCAERKENKVSRVDNFISASVINLDMKRESYLKLQVLAAKVGDLIYNSIKGLHFEGIELHSSHLGLFYVTIRL